jgi:tetraacyldisaccharide-1-P 4'-kinase
VADAVARARAAGADAVVTTAKDAVRLEGLPVAGLPVLVLEIEAAIADEARLRARLLAVAGRPL